LKHATFETNRGTIKAELYETDAPKTVANFEKLANDGVLRRGEVPPRHRRLRRAGRRSQLARLPRRATAASARAARLHDPDELAATRASTRWARSRWRTRAPNTGGSQFFMVLSESNTRHLNGVHTVFGKIVEGLDVMKQIQPERHDDVGAGRLTMATHTTHDAGGHGHGGHAPHVSDRTPAFVGLLGGGALVGGSSGRW
jgi:peptidyl-prolyl cis-trans isomerase B (cyclophilin B)